MALVAARLHVLGEVQRPEPELVAPVPLGHAPRRPAVAVVARGAPERLGVVNLQQLRAWMALEHRVDQVRGPDLDGLANPQVAGLAAVHEVDVHQVNLPDAGLEPAHVGDQAVDLGRAQPDQAIVHQGVALVANAIRLVQEPEALGLQVGAGLLQAQELGLQLLEFQLELLRAPRAVGERHLDFDDPLADFRDLLAEGVLFALVMRHLDQVPQGVDLAAQHLERVPRGGHPRNDALSALPVDRRDPLADRGLGGVEVRRELLVLGRVADGVLLGSLLRAQIHQEAGVVGAEAGLVLLVRAHHLDFVVDRPHERGHQQQHRHEQVDAVRLGCDRVRPDLVVFCHGIP